MKGYLEKAKNDMFYYNKFFNFLVINLVFILSLALTPTDIERYGLACISEKTIGIEIGTCGLTRATISISHLDFEKAIRYNLLIIFIYPMLLKFLIDSWIEFASRKKISYPEYLNNSLLIKIAGILIVIKTIVNWFV